ncbi:hypothetical protein [Streptomyces demainii]|uniref:Transposase InsO family protein n=1 Tax=Streptomyces demainii TaxID=588122 RepID=A0ABT9KS55_9ACTN|nr:hypothetical protein [Streptomyces demainii]MDP9611281.1 transposase InsO family protein [Streptomyces demainii]
MGDYDGQREPNSRTKRYNAGYAGITRGAFLDDPGCAWLLDRIRRRMERRRAAHRPGTRLVGDITYLPAQEGWMYLACWLEASVGSAPVVADERRIPDAGAVRPRPGAGRPRAPAALWYTPRGGRTVRC